MDRDDGSSTTTIRRTGTTTSGASTPRRPREHQRFDDPTYDSTLKTPTPSRCRRRCRSTTSSPASSRQTRSTSRSTTRRQLPHSALRARSRFEHRLRPLLERDQDPRPLRGSATTELTKAPGIERAPFAFPTETEGDTGNADPGNTDLHRAAPGAIAFTLVRFVPRLITVHSLPGDAFESDRATARRSSSCSTSTDSTGGAGAVLELPTNAIHGNFGSRCRFAGCRSRRW